MKEIIADLLKKEIKISKDEILGLIEIPPDEKLGDYAFPCFTLSKRLKKNPQQISELLYERLVKKLPHEIAMIKTQGAYLNFFINKKALAKNTLTRVLADREAYGKLIHEKEKILVEHTSVNPNAAPHVGRARNSIIGDSIVRILRFSKNDVETRYYINDVSKQVAVLALVCTGNETFNQLLGKYVKASQRLEDKEFEQQVFEILRKFEAKDKQALSKFKKIAGIAVQGQKKIFEEFGIKFDKFDYESNYMNNDFIIDKLEKTGKLFKDKEDRLVLNQTGTSVQRKMKFPYLVLTRSDGTGLYVLRDLAYTIDKMKDADRNIIILGEDQKLYFQQLKEALNLIGQPSPEAVHYSFVLIQEDKNKKAKKMSTRKGELVLLEEFIKEAETKAKKAIKERKTKGDAKKVAIAAVKYSMLKNDNNKSIIFNWNQALNFEGESGPYLLYSYARASSILRKAKIKTVKMPKINGLDLKPQETNLIKNLSAFPTIIQDAYVKLNPSILANYSFQLAKSFNEFYHACPVIKEEKQVKDFRLALVQAFRIVMKQTLYLLGIEAIEEM